MASRTSCTCARSGRRSGARRSGSSSETRIFAARSSVCAATISTWRVSPAGSSGSCGRTSSCTASGAATGRSALVLAGRELLVLVRVHQVLELALVGHLDLDQPPLVVRVLVHDRGMILELAVDRTHCPCERREQLRHRAD